MTGNALFHSSKVFLRKQFKLEGWRQQRTTRRTSLARLSVTAGATVGQESQRSWPHHWEIWVGSFQPFWCDFSQTWSAERIRQWSTVYMLGAEAEPERKLQDINGWKHHILSNPEQGLQMSLPCLEQPNLLLHSIVDHCPGNGHSGLPTLAIKIGGISKAYFITED